MELIDPVPFTDAVLTASNVVEVTVAEYDPATTYALAERRGVTTGTVQAIYQSAQAGNLNHSPASSPTWWTYVGSVYVAYTSGGVFDLGEIVTSIGADVHDLYKSLVAGNTGNPLTDDTKWQRFGKTNRWLMFDDQNNTQTECPESITIRANPRRISNGIYLGNVDADSVTWTMSDPVDGVLFTETRSLVLSTSGSSFFRWCFNRIVRRTEVYVLDLPMYYNATFDIVLSKPGGIAKCGMAIVGPIVDIGLANYGVETSIKDFSLIEFNADGTSETTEGGYVKLMSVDVTINNDVLDTVQRIFAQYRQKVVVWIGIRHRPSTVICGRYTAFKNVIQYFAKSKSSIQIDGTI